MPESERVDAAKEEEDEAEGRGRAASGRRGWPGGGRRRGREAREREEGRSEKENALCSCGVVRGRRGCGERMDKGQHAGRK